MRAMRFTIIYLRGRVNNAHENRHLLNDVHSVGRCARNSLCIYEELYIILPDSCVYGRHVTCIYSEKTGGRRLI